VEHLCLLYLGQARLGEGEAQRAVEEGLRVARQTGLGLYHIELLCAGAALCLARAELDHAEQLAREALGRALDSSCQFLWGAAEAGSLLGRTLAAQRRVDDARAIFTETLDLQRRLGDPRVELTEQLLLAL
jgi:hypothetical protein